MRVLARKPARKTRRKKSELVKTVTVTTGIGTESAKCQELEWKTKRNEGREGGRTLRSDDSSDCCTAEFVAVATGFASVEAAPILRCLSPTLQALPVDVGGLRRKKRSGKGEEKRGKGAKRTVPLHRHGENSFESSSAPSKQMRQVGASSATTGSSRTVSTTGSAVRSLPGRSRRSTNSSSSSLAALTALALR
jgi:hypothetical protein